MMDDAFAIIAIGLSIFIFLVILLGIGEFYGGAWSSIAQGVAPFILLIVAFCFGAFILVRVMRR